MVIDPVQEVRRAKARYCRFIDVQDWEGFRALLAPDIQVRMFDPADEIIASFDDREDFITSTRVFLDGARSSHLVHNEEIDMISSDEIAAVWAMEDLVVNPNPRPDQPARMHGYGRYHETWVCTADGWCLARLELRRAILEIN